MASDNHSNSGGAGVGARQYAVVGIVTMILVLEGFDVQLVAYAAPVIIREWHTSTVSFAPALGAAMIGMAMGTLAGGALGDRMGRRWTLIASTLFFGLATLLCA